MNEFTKTIAFAGSAIVLAGAAIVSHFVSQPSNSADFELIGTPFFESFNAADQAQSLEVVAVDPETGELKRFSVANQGGLWRIPSRFDYPAEAAARLATTAASVMGISRDSLEGRGKSEHERLGVVDPLSEEIEDPATAGKRITIKDGDGETVVDYIIGKQAEERVVLDEDERAFGNPRGEKYYYVRRPDEPQTYKVRLAIDLSTKFSDWIDPDLLRLDDAELTRVKIDNYSLQPAGDALLGSMRLVKQQGDQLALSRASATDKWMLAGLNETTETIEQPKIADMVSTLNELKIVGVRPKTTFQGKPLLTADLKLNRQPEFEAAPREFGDAMMQLQAELSDRGFNLAGTAEKLELVAQFGDLEVGTDQGVTYTLQFGKAVEGDESELELGITTAAATADKPGNKEADLADEAVAAESKTEDPANNVDATKPDAKNRYLMIRVGFDETLIGERPTKPVEPTAPVPPEGYKPAEPQTDSAEAAATNAAPEDVQPPEGEASAADDRKPEFVAYDAALEAFENAKVEYGVALTKFESELVSFEEQVELGKQRVQELNERFGDWYYVISAENLSSLRINRGDLVKPIEPKATDGGALKPLPAQPPRPDISFPALPTAGIEAMEQGAEKTPADDATSPDSPKTPAAKPRSTDDPKTDDPKTDDPKTEDPKTEKAKATPTSGSQY